MASRNASIAQAVATALAAATFSLRPVTVERVYAPEADAAKLKGLTVQVWQAGDEFEQLSRNQYQHTIVVGVLIRQRLAAGVDPTTAAGAAQIDPLMEFAEQVADFFKTFQIDRSLASKFRATHPVPFEPTDLYHNRVFTSVVNLQFFRVETVNA